MARCDLCVKFDDCAFRSDPDAQCSGFKQKPITNADRLRSMSDEELATWLNCMQSNAYHCGEFGRTNAAYPYNNEAWIDWLKEQAEEGE